MSERDSRNVRRFGRRDRKDRLNAPASLFPADADTPSATPEADLARFMPPAAQLPETLDLSALPEADDSEASAILASLPDEAVKLRVTPPEERFPPLPAENASLNTGYVPHYPTSTKSAQPTTTPSQSSLPTPAPAPATPSGTGYRLLTLLALLGTLVIVGVYIIIWQNPYSLLNPFPPPVLYYEVTATPSANAIPQVVIVTSTPALGVGFSFSANPEGVVYSANSNGRACDWQSIAGQVTDGQGGGINGYRIRVLGMGIDETVFSGTSPSFGAGGYELVLGNRPQTGEYIVQLLTPASEAASEPVIVTLSEDCQQNVAVLGFVRN